MANAKNKVIRLDDLIRQSEQRREARTSNTQRSAEVIAAPGVVQAVAELMDDVLHGDVVGVSIISYSSDWSFEISSAGSILRMPGAGIAAAHVLASEMESRLRRG